MPDARADRIALRRAVLAKKDEILALAEQVEALDPQAAAWVRKARPMLFEAWTILCGPPEEDEDH